MIDLAVKTKNEALKWIDEHYDVKGEEAYKNMLDYLFRGSNRLALEVSAFELSEGKPFHDEVAHIIHEMVEATELKKRYGYVKNMYDMFRELGFEAKREPHRIATQYEIEYLRSVGEYDLVKEVLRRERR